MLSFGVALRLGGVRLIGMTVVQALTLGIAGIGVVLGLINTWYAYRKDCVRLKVSLRRLVSSHGDAGMCVEVVNLSGFEITISELFVPVGKWGKEKYVTQHSGGNLPERLKPRAAHTFVFPSGAFEHAGCPKVGRFRVVTACGVMKTTNYANLRHNDPSPAK